MDKKKIIIIGAGPAGLTAAYLLSVTKDYEVIIYEKSKDIGGIAKTVEYKGNRIDLGGHRFFSKSDWVMDFWKSFFPIQGSLAKDDIILNREVLLSDEKGAPDPEKNDIVFLIRRRLSRIFYLRSFFDYPVSLNLNTIKNLGIIRIFKIGMSYVFIKLFPAKHEKSLEEFFINRFGKELYETFFKDYTEKVWGVSCKKIEPEWGAQRIKGLNITKAIIHSIKKVFVRSNDINQKETETSLIEKFMYPKYGPGQLWEKVADESVKNGCRIEMNKEVIKIIIKNNIADSVIVRNIKDNTEETVKADALFSAMPIKELIEDFDIEVDKSVRDVSDNLQYRDFFTVGLLCKKLKLTNQTKIKSINNIIPDNWIYIQERDVKVGRVQIFNNWSPYLVKDMNNVWIGLEYFATEGDSLWSMSDEDIAEFAIREMEKIGFLSADDILEKTVLRMEKAYPAYFGAYKDFGRVIEYLNTIENLYPMGRNGMHRYNNMDHSMLTAYQSVENFKNGIKDKSNIWSINTEEEYHEKSSD